MVAADCRPGTGHDGSRGVRGATRPRLDQQPTLADGEGAEMAGFTTRPVIQGTRGVIASGHYLSAAIGMHILETGGNAIDAGVAAGFALNLTKPQSTGIGGEAPILIHRAGDSSGSHPGPRIAAINGQGSAPARATIGWFREAKVDLIPGDGFLPITIPASFGAWVTALLYYGTMSLKDVLGPVVDTAAGGFAVYGALRTQIEKNAERYREEWPSTAEIYLESDGSVPAIGKILKNAAWAKTLQGAIDAEMREAHRGREAGLRAALDYWYRGPVAEAAVAFTSTTEVHDASGK